MKFEDVIPFLRDGKIIKHNNKEYELWKTLLVSDADPVYYKNQYQSDAILTKEDFEADDWVVLNK